MSHGAAQRGKLTYTYKAWRYMRNRVARDPLYAGVPVDPRWDDYANFLHDVGERPEGMKLDRIDGTKGYVPGNCRWATQKQQSNNQRTNVRVTYAGRTQTLSEWADELGMNYKTLHNRIYSCGWAFARAITTPLRGWNKQGRRT